MLFYLNGVIIAISSTYNGISPVYISKDNGYVGSSLWGLDLVLKNILLSRCTSNYYLACPFGQLKIFAARGRPGFIWVLHHDLTIKTQRVSYIFVSLPTISVLPPHQRCTVVMRYLLFSLFIYYTTDNQWRLNHTWYMIAKVRGLDFLIYIGIWGHI